jgi:anaerobic magnesium-protoporphyrin IX monomethyl ester cyclase
MAKILLVDPPWYIFQHIKTDSISLGIVYIATILKAQGHECLVYNGDFTTDSLPAAEGIIGDYQNYIDEMTGKTSDIWMDFKNVLEKFEPDYVGISILTPKYASATEIANIVKRFNPDIMVFVGGVHPTIQPGETIKESSFDIVVVGEGDETVPELVNTLELGKDLSQVSGIYYKINNSVFQTKQRPLIEYIDTIPFPDFSLLCRFEEYPPGWFYRILTSRGCPYRCIYCASNKLWGRKVRFRSPELVFEEIKYRHDRFGVRFFKFNDDTFTLNRQRLEQLCNLIIGDPMEIEWGCDTRADNINKELLTLMKKAGCCRINIGIESGSQEILEYIHKDESLETIRRAFLLTKKLKILTLAYFMMGFPNETKEDVLKSVKFMKEINPDIVCWSLFTPYPGTEIYDQITKEGRLPESPEWSRFFHQSPEMNFTKNISPQEWLELIDLVEKAVSEHQAVKAKENFDIAASRSFFARIFAYRDQPKLLLHYMKSVPKECLRVLRK